jgi:phage gp16-like protein
MNARPARFAPDPLRRSLLAKVHVARKELGLDEDTYRGVLIQVTGQSSAGELDQQQLVAVLDHFKLRGFTAQPRKAGAARPADHPSARKARALWISLYHLGAVRNGSEQALEAFAARQLKCERMQWMRQSDCYRLIEALKAMAERHGWAQRGPNGEQLSVEQLQEGLCEAILAKLKAGGVAPKTMPLSEAAFAFGGVKPGREPLARNCHVRIAASFGEWLRRACLADGGEA